MPNGTLEQSGPATSPAIDRRRSIRQEQNVPAWLSDASGGSNVASSQQQVSVSDLSLHGVGFRSPKSVSKEDAHWIVIATDRLHLSTRLRVVSVRQNAEGSFDVGAEFF